jgi:hypothetical protein
MRDHHGLEESTAAVSRGLLAGDAIIALDRVVHGEDLDQEGRAVIGEAEAFLRTLAHPDREETLSGPHSSLVPTGAVVSAAAHAAGQPPKNLQAFLDGLAAELGKVAAGEDADRDLLEIAVSLFSLIGDLELATANDIARDRQDPVRWLGTITPLAS